MDTASYMAGLRRELELFERCLAGDLNAPVEHCGDWKLGDLADHLGGGNLWSATAVTEKRGDYEFTAAPREPGELARWFRGTCEVLLTALDADPSTEAWTFFPPHTVGFWHRRRCMETLVHRWDAEHALGDTGPLDPQLAGDGVAEVIEVMFPRMVKGRRTEPLEHAIRLTATDTGETWTLGPGDPVATLEGTAETLFLMLWGRVSKEDPALDWKGDRTAGLQVLNRPLVP
jgi:uncharacterized protein (TIGR03083 family)